MHDKAIEITRGSQWSNTESDPHFYSGKYCTHLSVNYNFFPSLSLNYFSVKEDKFPCFRHLL